MTGANNFEAPEFVINSNPTNKKNLIEYDTQ